MYARDNSVLQKTSINVHLAHLTWGLLVYSFHGLFLWFSVGVMGLRNWISIVPNRKLSFDFGNLFGNNQSSKRITAFRLSAS